MIYVVLFVVCFLAVMFYTLLLLNKKRIADLEETVHNKMQAIIRAEFFAFIKDFEVHLNPASSAEHAAHFGGEIMEYNQMLHILQRAALNVVDEKLKNQIEAVALLIESKTKGDDFLNRIVEQINKKQLRTP